jgi:uncharacterized beta-barrel protein YwiB (DUF1934 family)
VLHTEFSLQKGCGEVSFSFPVKISLKTSIFQDGVREEYELIAFGRFHKKDGIYYLKYDEIIDSGTIHTTVKIKEDEVLILRSGSLNMRQAYKRDRLMSGTFETELGTFYLTTNTKELDFQWDPDLKKGTLKIHYGLIMEQVDVGTYRLTFTFQEDEKAVI